MVCGSYAALSDHLVVVLISRIIADCFELVFAGIILHLTWVCAFCVCHVAESESRPQRYRSAHALNANIIKKLIRGMKSGNCPRHSGFISCVCFTSCNQPHSLTDWRSTNRPSVFHRTRAPLTCVKVAVTRQERQQHQDLIRDIVA